MKEGPSGSAIRSLIPSHCKLLSSKAMVVNVAEKSGRWSRQARSREASASKLLLKRRKRIRWCQNRGLTRPPGSARRMSWYRPSGIRRVGSAKLDQAPLRNVRTWPVMPREKAQAAPTVRLKVPMRRRGADCLVVATKWGNAHGAKGVGHRRWARANWVKPGGACNISGRRQPSCDGTSRMMREYHVRICERLGVKFPGPTRHERRFRHLRDGSVMGILPPCGRSQSSSSSWRCFLLAICRAAVPAPPRQYRQPLRTRSAVRKRRLERRPDQAHQRLGP